MRVARLFSRAWMCTLLLSAAAATWAPSVCPADEGGGSQPSLGDGRAGYPALLGDRATAWNGAGLLSKGGVPSAKWPICTPKPLRPSGGDDSVQINRAIAACDVGSVVKLGPGTFIMGKGKYVSIEKGVVLRGSGPGVTILKNPLNRPADRTHTTAADTVPIIIIGAGRWVNPDGDSRCAGPTAYQPGLMQLLSADASKGSRSVTVESGALFWPGQLVLLDETSGASWQPDVTRPGSSIWASPDYTVQWQVHKPPIPQDDPVQPEVSPSPANNYATSGSGTDGACWFARQDRPQNEVKEIARVEGHTITFTSPLHKDYRAGRHAELTTFTGGNRHVWYAGIEDLTAVGGGSGAVRFENAAYSWAKHIEVAGWFGEGVAVDGGFRVEVRDSYIHDAGWPEPGGAGYAISLASGSSEILIENDVVVRANKVMVARSAGAGSVVAYNYMDHGYIATTEGWIEAGLNASHMVGSHHVLFEGNLSFNMESDDTHGNSTYHTFFRNWATTVRSKFRSGFTGNTIDDATTTQNGPKRAVGALKYSYWMSYVGNVLGKPGLTTQANGYVDSCGADWGHQKGMIWLLGWNDTAPYTVDAKVAATAIRDGNWDWVLGKQTWLTNTASTLPPSLYLSSKPKFFGSNPWPWVDPATGNTTTLPAQARYAAGTPNVVP
jgi:hypothetical protein